MAICLTSMKEYGTVYDLFHISKALCLILDSESWPGLALTVKTCNSSTHVG